MSVRPDDQARGIKAARHSPVRDRLYHWYYYRNNCIDYRHQVSTCGGKRKEMSLNIKNKEAHALAEELAGLTGESLTTAVTVALRERLMRIKGEKEARLNRMVAIAKRCAGRLSKDQKKDHGEWLYDDNSLPA